MSAALNYGFNAITHPEWQISYTDERVRATFDEMLNVMRFWLDRGCDGFRVDMAGSLVKNDPEQEGTIFLWQDFMDFLKMEFPEAAMDLGMGTAGPELTGPDSIWILCCISGPVIIRICSMG